MFNINVLQYLVFFVIAIPPFIIGWYKGWRSGLFTLLLTFVSGGILTGVAVGFYDSLLWPIFRYLFVQKQANGVISVEALKEISKLSVIVVSVGILILPVVALNYLIYFGFSRLLNKYMKPTIKQISPNKIEIVTKNLFRTRLGGLALNGVAGLVVAATATNAVATLTTNSRSSNIFNSFTSAIGQSMTFGQGAYDEEYQKIYEFIGDVKDYRIPITSFNNVFNISQEYKANKVELIQGENFIKKINEFSTNSERLSKALILLFFNAVKDKGVINLVGSTVAQMKGYDVEKDLNYFSWDSAELIKDDASVEELINKFTFGTNHLSLNLNRQGVYDAVEEFYNKRFVPFDKTVYARQNNYAINYLTKLHKMLGEKISKKNKLPELIKKQKIDIKLQAENLILQRDEIMKKYSKLGDESFKKEIPFSELSKLFNSNDLDGQRIIDVPYQSISFPQITTDNFKSQMDDASGKSEEEANDTKLTYDNYKNEILNDYMNFKSKKINIEAVIEKYKNNKNYIKVLSGTGESSIDYLNEAIKTWTNRQQEFNKLTNEKKEEYNKRKIKIIKTIVEAIV